MRRPALGRDTSIMQERAGKVLNQIDEHAEAIYREGLIDDIKARHARAADAPGVDVGYRQRIRAVMEAITETKPSQRTLDRLENLQDYIDREKAAGREPPIPQGTTG